MAQLSFDLHVHPGPSSVPRWGTGAEVQAAAARAGVRGFVWKSHDGHTARACRELAATPRAIGSASLNAWAGKDDVAAAVGDGARWVWGPTYKDGKVGWELPLPSSWDGDRRLAARMPRAAGSWDRTPRRPRTPRLRRACRRAPPHLLCSITHSLYLPEDEVVALRGLGCVFEVDLYTGTHKLPDRPPIDLATGIPRLRALGATVYLTSDAGQRDTGDPYVFSAATAWSACPDSRRGRGARDRRDQSRNRGVACLESFALRAPISPFRCYPIHKAPEARRGDDSR